MENLNTKNTFFTLKKSENRLLLLGWLTIVGLIYSRFLLTLSMILWVLAAFLSFSRVFPFLKLNPDLKNQWQILKKNKAFWVVTLFFFMVAVSVFWSEDLHYLGERVRIRLPFLFLPLAFGLLSPISEKIYHQIFYFLIAILVVTMVGVLINYSLKFEAINETLLRGKNVPVPMNYIRFSLLVAFAIIVGVILFLKNQIKNIKIFLTISVIILFAGLHILAVRSGLLCFYVASFLLGLRYVVLSKKYYFLTVLVFFSIGLPLAAYQLIPNIQNKIRYSLYDWEQFQQGKGANYSDAERIGSIMAGLKVGNDSPILGCGYGDLQTEISKAYQEVFPQEQEPKIPHNQYVMIYAGLGFFGLSLFLFAFLFPIFYEKNYREPIFFTLNIITVFSFMVEGTIETQVGTAIYAFFLCLGLNFLKTKKLIC